MEKILLGKKSKNEFSGLVFYPYITQQIIYFPEIKFNGFDEKGKPKFIKIK